VGGLIFWMLVFQVFFVRKRKRKLKCPHCHEYGVSASKILHFGPAWSFRCSQCQRKHKASYWFLPLTLVTALSIGFVIMTSLTKVDSRIVDFPTFIALPTILMLDLWLRFYVIPLKKK